MAVQINDIQTDLNQETRGVIVPRGRSLNPVDILITPHACVLVTLKLRVNVLKNSLNVTNLTTDSWVLALSGSVSFWLSSLSSSSSGVHFSFRLGPKGEGKERLMFRKMKHQQMSYSYISYFEL